MMKGWEDDRVTEVLNNIADEMADIVPGVIADAEKALANIGKKVDAMEKGKAKRKRRVIEDTQNKELERLQGPLWSRAKRA